MLTKVRLTGESIALASPKAVVSAPILYVVDYPKASHAAVTDPAEDRRLAI